MYKQVKFLGAASCAAIIVFFTAACASNAAVTSSGSPRAAKAGVISYDIDANLQYLWTGTDFDNDGEVIGDFYSKTIQFSANSLSGSSDIVLHLNILLSDMAKEGDAKLIAKDGVIRFTGFHDGFDMSQVPQWFTYSLGDGGYALTIRDIPTNRNGQTTPDVFEGDRDLY